MSQPLLSLPKRENKFRVEMDASDHAIEGVLLQEQEGKWKTDSIFIQNNATSRKEL